MSESKDVLTAGGSSEPASDAGTAVVRLADTAVEWVSNETQRLYTEQLAPVGMHGRSQTRQDLHSHIDFLVGALETSTPEYFRDYVRWLSGAMRTRGIPLGTLRKSLSLMLEFFNARLDPPVGGRVVGVLSAGLSALSETTEREPLIQAPLPPSVPESATVTPLLLNGDRKAVQVLANKLSNEGLEHLHIATRLFQPALYQIGLLWERNEITVAQEHLATAISESVLAELFFRAALPQPCGKKALFACVENNHHALGLRMVSDAFELAGWSAQFLGADTPSASLITQVEAGRPDVVGLSVSLVQQLPTLKRVVRALRAKFGERCPSVLVGGIPINTIHDMWRTIGADAWSPHAECAVSVVHDRSA
jgi:methanogenic corrinoid protein MtbC1